MPCPSLTAFGLDKKDYFTSFNTGSSAYFISQARLDAYRREVLILVKMINKPNSAIIGVDVNIGNQTRKTVLSLGSMITGQTMILSRFYLTDFDVFNFQQGLMNFVVKTADHQEGEVHGRYQMSTCYLAEYVPTKETQQMNTGYAQVQVAMDGTEAFVTVMASNTTNENGMKPFEETGTNTEEAALVNVVLPFVNGKPKGSQTLLPGIAPPPVVLEDPDGDKKYPLMHTTFGGSAAAMAEVTGKMVLGQVTLTMYALSDTVMAQPVIIKTVEDPSKYVVEEGDTLASIAEKKGFDSWVPLQMVNRLTTLTLSVGQVLDLCYRHRVMTNETIYGIAD
jgi:LysM repeat protein